VLLGFCFLENSPKDDVSHLDRDWFYMKTHRATALNLELFNKSHIGIPKKMRAFPFGLLGGLQNRVPLAPIQSKLSNFTLLVIKNIFEDSRSFFSQTERRLRRLGVHERKFETLLADPVSSLRASRNPVESPRGTSVTDVLSPSLRVRIGILGAPPRRHEICEPPVTMDPLSSWT